MIQVQDLHERWVVDQYQLHYLGLSQARLRLRLRLQRFHQLGEWALRLAWEQGARAAWSQAPRQGAAAKRMRATAPTLATTRTQARMTRRPRRRRPT